MRWCAGADVLLNIPGIPILDVGHDEERGRVEVTVETDADVGGCPACGVVAVGTDAGTTGRAEAPCFGQVSVIRWRKRIWRCAEPACPVVTFSEEHEMIAPPAKLSSRAIGWATDALAHDDTTVSALARHLGVEATRGWPTRRGSMECACSASMSTSGGPARSGTRNER